MAVALRSRARYHHLAGQHRAAIPLLEQALALSERSGDAADVATVLAWLSGAYQHLADYGQSNAWARRIVEIDEQRTTPLAGALGWEFLAENAAGAGRLREAIDAAQRDYSLGERVHDGSRLAWASYALAWAYHSMGELAAATEALERCALWAARDGDPRVARLGEAMAVLVATDRGDEDAAARAAASLSARTRPGCSGCGSKRAARRRIASCGWATGEVLPLAAECRELLAGTDRTADQPAARAPCRGGAGGARPAGSRGGPARHCRARQDAPMRRSWSSPAGALPHDAACASATSPRRPPTSTSPWRGRTSSTPSSRISPAPWRCGRRCASAAAKEPPRRPISLARRQCSPPPEPPARPRGCRAIDSTWNVGSNTATTTDRRGG